MNRAWNWGVAVATVYVAFAGATVGFVAFAMRQHVDLVSADYYAESLAHDQRQAAIGRVQDLGKAFRIDVDEAGRSASIAWPPQARPDHGSITFYRAAESRLDRREVITAESPATRRVDLTALAAGPWLLQCEWTSGGKQYYAEIPLVLR